MEATNNIAISSCCDDNKGLLEYARKSTPPPFLLKTYMLIEDPATDNVISWNGDGTGFVVWQPAEFARDLLPTLFKHSNFSSFVRQLNTYGFRKVATGRWEFCNQMFRKGEKDLLCKIRRRKAWANRQQAATAAATQQESHDEDQRSSSSTSSLSEYNTLRDENKRLKKENGNLSSELVRMKRKCKELLDLVAKYANMDNDDDDEDDDGHEINNNQRGPLIVKLFGVRFEVDEGERERKRKRKRAEIISQSANILLSQSCK
ncbi:hypothetical protein AB3S75_045371 [Citrus x aurantiifolia]